MGWHFEEARVAHHQALTSLGFASFRARLESIANGLR